MLEEAKPLVDVWRRIIAVSFTVPMAARRKPHWPQCPPARNSTEWNVVVPSLYPPPGKQRRQIRMSNQRDFDTFGIAFFEMKRHTLVGDFAQQVRIPLEASGTFSKA